MGLRLNWSGDKAKSGAQKFLHVTISRNPDSLDDSRLRAHRNLDLNPHERGLRHKIDASLVPHGGDDVSGELDDLR